MSFERKEDLEFYYPELNISLESLNDNDYERALDKFGEINMHEIVSVIRLAMFKIHEVTIKTIHLNTTSKSAQRKYSNENDDGFNITYDRSRDYLHVLKAI